MILLKSEKPYLGLGYYYQQGRCVTLAIVQTWNRGANFELMQLRWRNEMNNAKKDIKYKACSLST